MVSVFAVDAALYTIWVVYVGISINIVGAPVFMIVKAIDMLALDLMKKNMK